MTQDDLIALFAGMTPRMQKIMLEVARMGPAGRAAFCAAADHDAEPLEALAAGRDAEARALLVEALGNGWTFETGETGEGR